MFGWQDILDFWFGALDEQGLPPETNRNRWFRDDRKVDQELRRRFMSMVLLASEQGLKHWRKEGAGAVMAELLLLDPFPRHIHRGSALAFEHDALARSLCNEGLRKGYDMALPPTMRAFFYLPLMHSERKADQVVSLDCYQQLHVSVSGMLQVLIEGFLAAAQRHHDVIQRFGRFPDRNKVMGRPSSAEELTYLQGVD